MHGPRNMVDTWMFTLLLWTLAGQYAFSVAQEELLAERVRRELRSYKFLRQLNSLSPKLSTLCSPASVFHLLKLYSVGAPDDVRTSLLEALDFTDYTQLQYSYIGMSGNLSYRKEYATVGSQVYFQQELKPTQEFLQTAAYGTSVGELDFSDPEEAAEDVNSWANAWTEGVIKEPMSGFTFDPYSTNAMISTVFFKGHWAVPFRIQDTKKHPYQVNNIETALKNMMSSVQSGLFYAESEVLNAKLLALPYSEETFQMLIILPNDVTGLSPLLETIQNSNILYDTLLKMLRTDREIHIMLPRFQLRTRIDATEVINNLGLSKFYTSPASGIVEDYDITLGTVIQETYINVDEGDTTETYTGVSSDPSADHLTFHATHPFIFAVMKDNSILLMGTYIT